MNHFEALTENGIHYNGDIDPINHGGTWYDMSTLEDGYVYGVEISPDYEAENLVYVLRLRVNLDASDEETIMRVLADRTDPTTPADIIEAMREYGYSDSVDWNRNTPTVRTINLDGATMPDWLPHPDDVEQMTTEELAAEIIALF